MVSPLFSPSSYYHSIVVLFICLVNGFLMRLATRKQVKIDVNQMIARKQMKEEPMVDEGTGKIKVHLLPSSLYISLSLLFIFFYFVSSPLPLLSSYLFY